MRERIMIQALVSGLSVLCLFLTTWTAAAQEKKPKDAPARRTPRYEDKNWLKRHHDFVAMAQKGDIELLFLGDSITDAWGGKHHNPKSRGTEIFTKEFEPLKAANFGIGGDRCEDVLWRLQHGELDGMHPKVVMLMVGTNNTRANTAKAIADGITAVVNEIHKRSPETKVLLLGIFPRGQKPNPVRDTIKQVNETISRLDDGGKTVKYLDIGDRFVQPDGTISAEIMPDYLHLSEKGYRIWADAVKDPIHEMLGKK